MTAEILERMATKYRIGDDALVDAEREALGSDYGANGYTTLAQADELLDLLEPGPDTLLLDLGAGCGWPGLYMAGRSGCRLVSVDPVADGVRRTAARSTAEGLDGRSLAILGDGGRLPIVDDAVDVLVHSDVLC